MDWKAKQSSSVSLFFNCKTTLVETCKEIFGELFQYEGTREIVIPLSQELPIEALKHIFSLALRYHKIKHLPLLGF